MSATYKILTLKYPERITRETYPNRADLFPYMDGKRQAAVAQIVKETQMRIEKGHFLELMDIKAIHRKRSLKDDVSEDADPDLTGTSRKESTDRCEQLFFSDSFHSVSHFISFLSCVNKRRPASSCYPGNHASPGAWSAEFRLWHAQQGSRFCFLFHFLSGRKLGTHSVSSHSRPSPISP